MAATFADFLDPAGQHIEQACSVSDLPRAAAVATAQELSRLASVLARYLPAATADGRAAAVSMQLTSDATRSATAARTALTNVVAALSPVADSAPSAPTSPAAVHPAAAHLRAAAVSLAAGRDLLNTHLPPPSGAAHPGPGHWAPVITSPPVAAALIAELARHTLRLARWCSQLPVDGNESAIGGAVYGASRWLWEAEAELDTVRRACPATSSGHLLLRAIPVNTVPSRQQPGPAETIGELCTGAVHAAERLRFLAAASAGHSAALPEGVPAASWRRTAQAAAIIGHASEAVLRRLAIRSRQLGMGPDIAAQLRGAAARTARAWLAARAAARAWDTFTDGSATLADAAPAGEDLVLWIGRLAHGNKAWTPALRHLSALRDPEGFGPDATSIKLVLSAVHHAADVVAHLLAADRQAVRAAAGGRLFVPARLLVERPAVAYRYVPAPAHMLESLLRTYGKAAAAAGSAVQALDNRAAALGAPSHILAIAHAAARTTHPTTPAEPAAAGHKREHTARRARGTPQPMSAGVEVEQVLRELKVTEPALLRRAASIDQAARELIAEASARQVAAADMTRRTTGPHDSTRSAAQVAAKDTPSDASTPAAQQAVLAAPPDSGPGSNYRRPHAHTQSVGRAQGIRR